MSPPEILIVEDEHILRSIYEEELIEAGFPSTGVASGEAALRLLESKQFDLLITDINLAGSVSGIVLLGKCSTDYRDTKVIVITGMTGIANAPVGRSGFPGSDLTLFKPFEYGELTQSVKSVLSL